IPIPLSKERLEERAFNQATLIGNLLGDVDESLLIRQNNDKQSKKTKQERINSSNPFKVTRKITENILLVDDIYTTGSTLRHAAKLLKENSAKEVKSFNLIRNKKRYIDKIIKKQEKSRETMYNEIYKYI